MRVVREGTVTLPNGVVLVHAGEAECGCVWGVDKRNDAFVILPCRADCEVYAYAQEAMAKNPKPTGMMVETKSRKEYDALMRKLRRTASKK